MQVNIQSVKDDFRLPLLANIPRPTGIPAAVIGILGVLWLLRNLVPDYPPTLRHRVYFDVFAAGYALLVVAALYFSFVRKRALERWPRWLAPLWLLTWLPIAEHRSYATFWMSNLCALAMVGYGFGGTASLAGWGTRAHAWVLAVARWKFLGSLLCVFLVCTLWCAFVVFGNIPHIQDSVAQYLHGRVLASGQLTAPSHPLPDFFELWFMINTDGRWYPQYPPGHSAALALGHLVHAPWLVNPLLGAASLLLTYRFARQIAGESVARLAAVLFCASPFVIWMSSEYMNHASALFWTLVAANAFEAWLRAPRVANATLVGVGIGMLAITRPMTALGVGVPLAAVMTWHLLQDRRRLASAIAAGFAAGCFVLLYAYFNWRTTGDPLKTGYATAAEVRNTLWDFDFPGLTAALNIESNFVGLNHYLLGLPIPSLALCLLAYRRERLRSWPTLFAVIFGCVTLGYATFQHAFWCFGPRYLYETVGFLVILAALGLHKLFAALPRRHGLLTLLLATCAVVSVLKIHPMFYREFDQNYFNVDAHRFHAIEAQLAGHRSLVFVNDDFRAFASRTLPKATDEIIYAIDLGAAENRKLAALYPDHQALQQELDVVRPYPWAQARAPRSLQPP